MPIYVYRCANCSGEIEKRQGFSDAPLTTCESCGGSLRRVLQPAGVIFKGSGWYSTDYRNGANGKKSGGDSGDSSDKGSSDSTTKSDAATAKSDSTSAKSEGSASKPAAASNGSKSD
ncbi:MAG TPA: FmdB family zinc ribbon protein [Chloroflexota bacterium]|jgi:putative FmdB family regulatory protein